MCSVQDPLEFPAHEVRKYFRMGDHVKVIAGRYEGDTGLIVRVEENFVILFSDLTMHEVRGLQCLHPPFLTVPLCQASGHSSPLVENQMLLNEGSGLI